MRMTSQLSLLALALCGLPACRQQQSQAAQQQAATAGAAAASTDPAAGDLAGEWRAQLQFSSGAFAPIKDLEFMYSFNQGGTMTESSNYDASPPVPPA
jgi:hypothetical protein